MSEILLIGGTDPSGAGLQTDWKVVHRLQINASSVVTAVTSQNRDGVFDQGVLPYSQIKSQLNSLNNQLFAVIKIGMLGNANVIQAVVEFIHLQHSINSNCRVILDPVLASSSGGTLIDEAGKQSLLNDLLPLCTLITPNIHELESLVDQPIHDYQELESAAHKLITLGAKSTLIKGGHFHISTTDKTPTNTDETSNDFFISNDPHINIKKEKEQFYLKGSRWPNRSNVRGTGCSLATAIACQLSQGFPLNDAIVTAKAMISNGIRNAQLTETGQYSLEFIQGVDVKNSDVKNSDIKNTEVTNTRTKNTEHPFEFIDMPRLAKSADLLSKQYNIRACDENVKNKKLGIYPVVDSLEWLEKLIPLGVETIQLRIKDKNSADVEEDIIAAIHLGNHQIRLFINDYWQLAIKHKAYGIHLGQEDIDKLTDADLTAIAQSGCRLGISTHSYTEVARALQIHPSYIAVGPVFDTTSKIMPWIPQGVTAVKKWVELLNEDYPLVAIGGINVERAEALKQTGVGSVAMISAITKADDYKKAIQDLLQLWDS